MNANELMIGNYVNYQGRAQKICALNMNSVKIGELAYDDHRETLSNDSIKPISLTEEWLLKFGFEKDKYGNLTADLNKEFLLLELMKIGEEWCVFVVKKNDKENCFSLPRIKHIYQLQNLYFALTQKELTIN